MDWKRLFWATALIFIALKVMNVIFHIGIIIHEVNLNANLAGISRMLESKGIEDSRRTLYLMPIR